MCIFLIGCVNYLDGGGYYPIPRPLPQEGKGSKPLPFWGEVWRGSSPLDAD